MQTTNKKAIAYSLLSHIRNSGTLISGPLDYFVPLVKRSLNSLNSRGIKGGKSIIEICDEVNNMFSLDIPIPVLSNILRKIEKEENTSSKNNFKLFVDNSYQLRDYYFQEYEELFQEKTREIEELNSLFKQFCEINDYTTENAIIEYIEKNKKSLLHHLKCDYKTKTEAIKNGIVEAKFIDYFRNIPKVYDLIKNIYLGSIISTYLELEISEYKQDIELLLDTNFIVSLLDLNTPESTKTCKKVIELSAKRGFRISVMDDTIKEIQQLLYKKAENINNSTLIKYVNPEDILNACERRGMNRSDLERLADNIIENLNKKGFNILYVQSNMRNTARHSQEYNALKDIRNNKISALHDATAILYVKEKRKKRLKKFEEVNCWFVNNSINNDDNNETLYNDEFIRETIRADELLSVLWLSNPEVKKDLNQDEFAEIGLNSMIAISLNSSIPKASVIKELEDNIFRYGDDGITEKDILNLATRITNSQIKSIQEINEIAEKGNKDEFVKKIKKESEKQEEIEKDRNLKLKNLFETLKGKIDTIDNEIEAHNQNSNILNKENVELKEEVSFLTDELERERINNSIRKWQNKSIYLLLVSLIVFVLSLIFLGFISEWELEKFYKKLEAFKEDIILSCSVTLLYSIFNIFVLVNIYNRYFNESNIKAFKDNLALRTPKIFNK